MLRERTNGTLERLLTTPVHKLDLLAGYAAAFARTEFQAVQFMPAVVVPQLLLCGLVWPREPMAGLLEAISRALPMTYAIDALREVAGSQHASATTWWNLVAVAAAAVVALMLGAATLRRRTPYLR